MKSNAYGREGKERKARKASTKSKSAPSLVTTSKENSTSLTPSTALKTKGASYFEGICSIIKTCKEADVLELHLGELSVFRTTDAQYLAFASRKPLSMPASWGRPAENKGDLAPLTRTDKDMLEAQEAIMREEMEANLPLTDPMAYERMQMEALDSNAVGMTAEQVAELEDEGIL